MTHFGPRPSRLWFTFSLLLVALAGCGDDSSPDASSPDAMVDAGPGDATVDTGRADTGPADSGSLDAGLTDVPEKGPWSLQPTTTGFIVRWESQLAPATVAVQYEPEAGGVMLEAAGSSTSRVIAEDYGPLPPLSMEPDLRGTYYINEVEVTGLSPATCYTYEVVDQAGFTGRACTLHTSDDHTTPIVAYVVGDTNPALGHTVPLFDHQDPRQAEFVIHVGDVQYYMSVVESWQTWFRLMSPLLEAGPFMVCIGNHEMEKLDELNDYYRPFFAPTSAESDSTMDRYHYESGGVHFFALNSEIDVSAGSEQITWFAAKLDEVEVDPNYRFSIVYFHRPLYSFGDYVPRTDARSVIEPILTSHRVPLVIAGHMHGYERFEIGGITHITSAGGGGLIGNVDEHVPADAAEAAVRVSSGGFYQSLMLTIDSDNIIHGVVMDDLGTVQDSFDKTVVVP